MTVECLKNALALIENYFGRPLSTDERTARSQIYAAALKDIPDDVAAAALTKALTVCRYQNQLLVDWCAEIRKLQSAGQPTANDLWTQAIVAARKIERNQYYATHGGLVTATGKLTAEDFRAENRSIFGALPAAVREWAGSPAGLVDALDRSNADLLQYVKPGFVKAVDAAKDADRMPPALPSGGNAASFYRVAGLCSQPFYRQRPCQRGLYPPGRRTHHGAGHLRQPERKLDEQGRGAQGNH